MTNMWTFALVVALVEAVYVQGSVTNGPMIGPFSKYSDEEINYAARIANADATDPRFFSIIGDVLETIFGEHHHHSPGEPAGEHKPHPTTPVVVQPPAVKPIHPIDPMDPLMPTMPVITFPDEGRPTIPGLVPLPTLDLIMPTLPVVNIPVRPTRPEIGYPAIDPVIPTAIVNMPVDPGVPNKPAPAEPAPLPEVDPVLPIWHLPEMDSDRVHIGDYIFNINIRGQQNVDGEGVNQEMDEDFKVHKPRPPHFPLRPLLPFYPARPNGDGHHHHDGSDSEHGYWVRPHQTPKPRSTTLVGWGAPPNVPVRPPVHVLPGVAPNMPAENLPGVLPIFPVDFKEKIEELVPPDWSGY